MSVDTQVHINPEFSVSHIVDYVKSLYPAVELIYHDSQYFVCVFDKKCLNIFIGSGIFGSNRLTMRKTEENQTFLQNLAQTFGGVYQPDDCEEGSCTVYDDSTAKYNKSNAVFVHKWALSKGYVSGSEIEDFIEADKKFKAFLNG